jgi:hypothetical protein
MKGQRARDLPRWAAVCAVLLPACERPSSAERSGPAAHEPLIQLSRDEPRRASGRVFDDRDFRLEVGSPQICNETAPFLPEPGSMRISIPVELRAKSRRLIPTSPLSFQLTDGQGRTYGPTLAGCRPALQNTQLGEGQSIEGDVAFDVAVGARDLELGFEPFLIGRLEVRALVRVPTPTNTRPAPPNEPADEPAR